MVKEQKKGLYCSLVGFLKSKLKGLVQVELRLERWWGRRPANIQMSDDQVVWLQFLMEKEVDEVLEIAVSKGTSSPSAVLERWMEILGSSPCPVWVRFKGVPLQAWHKDIFKLLGDCVGRIVEVDKKTAQKKILREGRAKR